MASPLPHKSRTRAREMIESREDLARRSPISYSVASNRRSPTAFGHAVAKLRRKGPRAPLQAEEDGQATEHASSPALARR